MNCACTWRPGNRLHPGASSWNVIYVELCFASLELEARVEKAGPSDLTGAKLGGLGLGIGAKWARDVDRLRYEELSRRR